MRTVRATVDQAVDLIWDDVAGSREHVFALVNGQSASLRRSSADYAAAIEDARTIPLPDGAAISIGARWVGAGDVGRSPGPDVFSAACRRAAQDGTTFYLLGGGPGVAEKLRDTLAATYPGLQVRGVATPPFGEWDSQVSAELTGAVRSSGAQVLWLGVSAPKQEIWALEHIDALGVPVVCVGAAFDFLSNTKPRAPRWMREHGLEWVFRLSTEPARLWRRYLLGNTRFLIDLAKYRDRPPT